ncbi:hypothetical protein M2352_004242 [Azospirillum fermentarium]|uniref:hypothetical protein n=1 Tax=Azospirillum fermentarium TaxID=1233114 RepID=UPI0022279677|nr:hypothetical protein [Azospirillum fermentarium]MCW2248582.1 hypothetical protein [Azospirillum fermentarium]
MMYPLLVFATGLLAGAAGVRLLKGVKGPLKATGQQATGAVRGAAVSGLSAIERTSACLRTKLEPEAAAAAAPETTEPDTSVTDTTVTDTPVTDTAEPAPRPEGTAP